MYLASQVKEVRNALKLAGHFPSLPKSINVLLNEILHHFNKCTYM